MKTEYTVMWAAKISADTPEEDAKYARQTIANVPYSYFDTYKHEQPCQVKAINPSSIEISNEASYIDNQSYPYYPLAPKKIIKNLRLVQ